jgi:dUTP pyrophosphatase
VLAGKANLNLLITPRQDIVPRRCQIPLEELQLLAPHPVLNFKRLHPSAVLPTRGTPLSAGLDIYCIDDLLIEPKARLRAPTGLSVAVPEGFYGRIAPRSGLALDKGIDVLAGVVDADYRGEIVCLLYNTGDEIAMLRAGSKICQLIIEQVITPPAVWADDLSDTTRGSGGFGSTG